MTSLPDLGVGLMYWPELEYLIDAGREIIDVLEIEPQPFWFAPVSPTAPYQLDRRVLERLQRFPQPKTVHGVGFPVGGTVTPNERSIAPFAESITEVGAHWASEHLSFNRARVGDSEVDVGFLLPPIQSPEGVALAVSNIRVVQAHLSVPFAFETGVSYLRPTEGELSDGAFFGAIAEAADCGILLDLHNVWANEHNGRQPVMDLVDELPLQRIWEIHLAGGDELDGFWVDAHSGLVPSEVMDLARDIVPRLPNLKAIIFEIMPEYVSAKELSTKQLLDQLKSVHELWNLRRSAANAHIAPRWVGSPRTGSASLSPESWERSLAAAVVGITTEDGFSERLMTDPGVGILRRLVGAVRAGKVADSLKLSTRLLLLTLGEEGLERAFDDFWRSIPPEPMASDEARQFAEYARVHLGEQVPYLDGVLDFELASHRVLMEERAQSFHLPFDLRPVLAALREGQLPRDVASGEYEVKIEVPTA